MESETESKVGAGMLLRHSEFVSIEEKLSVEVIVQSQKKTKGDFEDGMRVRAFTEQTAAGVWLQTGRREDVRMELQQGGGAQGGGGTQGGGDVSTPKLELNLSEETNANKLTAAWFLLHVQSNF